MLKKNGAEDSMVNPGFSPSGKPGLGDSKVEGYRKHSTRGNAETKLCWWENRVTEMDSTFTLFEGDFA